MKYYYNKDNQNHGPVTYEELQELAKQGEIQKQTPVIEVGKKVWTRWGKLSEPEAAKAVPAAPLRTVSTPRATVKPKAKEKTWEEKFAFVGKITHVYDTVDHICEKVCFLPGGLVDTPEQYKKNLSILNACVGVGTLLSLICLCLGHGLYQNISMLLGLLITGAVLQYICYQMYSAMTPLLFGNKIKLSSLWLPRTLSLFCALLILASILMMFADGNLTAFLKGLGSVLFLACVGYSCVNCSKLSVALCPEDVVPGRELINLVRFVVRVIFTTVHILTPLYMIIAALILLTSGQKDLLPPGVPMSFDYLFFIAGKQDVLYALVITSLPIFTLPLFYLFSFIPDFVESFFLKGGSDRH